MGKRLFVDLDGTCAKWNAVAEEQLFEEGYYRNLEPNRNVVDAVNYIVKNHPEIEVYVLSKYLTDSQYALMEKDEWVSEYLGNIDKGHRIFVPYEMDKRDMIPDRLQETDYLLDDYTKNFDSWQPPARGIKLLNGINHTKGSWRDNRISIMRNPKDFAEAIVNIIEKGETIMDKAPQEQLQPNRALKQAIEESIKAVPESNLEMEM